MLLRPDENLTTWYDAHVGVDSISFGAADIRATEAAEAGLGARSRVRETVTGLVMSLPAHTREQIERELRAAPTGGARTDIDDTVDTIGFAAFFATTEDVQRQLKLAQGYLRALSEPAVGFKAAVRRCIQLVGQVLQHDHPSLEALGWLIAVLDRLSAAARAESEGDLLDANVTDARDAAGCLRSHSTARLTMDGLERLGLLLGRLELLPERRWAAPTTTDCEGSR